MIFLLVSLELIPPWTVTLQLSCTFAKSCLLMTRLIFIFYVPESITFSNVGTKLPLFFLRINQPHWVYPGRRRILNLQFFITPPPPHTHTPQMVWPLLTPTGVSSWDPLVKGDLTLFSVGNCLNPHLLTEVNSVLSHISTVTTVTALTVIVLSFAHKFNYYN